MAYNDPQLHCRVGAPINHPEISKDVRKTLCYIGFNEIVRPMRFYNIQRRTPQMGVTMGVR